MARLGERINSGGARVARQLPARSYVICTTPRTGSYLLCEALRNTGIAGKPTEYFSPGYQQFWTKRWSTNAYPAFLRRVTRIGTTANGVFGVKVHSIQFDHFLRQASGKATVPVAQGREILERWFPAPRYVWLRRENHLRQAVSYARALQTKIWWDADKAPAPFDAPRPDAVAFDRDLIERSITQLNDGNARWREYFEAHRIEPLLITYEQLIDDVDQVVRNVIAHLGLELPVDLRLPPSQFRRQADAITEEWLERYRTTPSNGAGMRAVPQTAERASAPPATAVHRSRPPLRRPADLDGLIANRQWWLCTTPFRHVRAQRVFAPDVYQQMATDFQDRLAGGQFARDIPGYDVSALGLTAEEKGAFSVFISAAWRELFARLLAPDSSNELNLTLHHHGVGSQSGTVHNDLNPGWFVDNGRDDIVVADPAMCAYRSGKGSGGQAVVERVRSVAIIFYLANPESCSGWGGATGLYSRGSDPVDRPAVAVPPVNNSLVAFECTPFSFHSFITNPHLERNCLVMWLHRPKENVVRRWGERSIVGW